MPESTLTVKLDSADADREAQKLTKSLGQLSKAGDKVDDEFEDVNKELEKSKKGFGVVEKATSSLKKAIGGIGVGLFAQQIFSASQTQQKAIADVESRIISTGQAAGFTSEELEMMAASFQKATAVGDEAILGFQSVLLTFTNVTGKNFERATEQILNMSAVMGTDLQSATLQVGKALNDPVRGIEAMNRAGVQFNKTQRETIKGLVESGNIFEAQTIILNELETQFGGAARAAKQTFAGALQSVQNAFGDLLETDSGLNAASEALLDLEETLSDPKVVQAAEALTSSLIIGFTALLDVLGLVGEAIEFTFGPLARQGQRLGAALADLTLGRDDRLANQIEDVKEQIDDLDQSYIKGKISLEEYKDEIAGLTEALLTLRRQRAGGTEGEVEEFVGPPEPPRPKLSPQGEITPSDAQEFIKDLQRQADVIGLTSRELEIYQLKLEKGVTPALIKQAEAILDVIDAKNEAIAADQRQQEFDEAAIEAAEEQNKAIEERSKLLMDYAESIDPVLAAEKQRNEELGKLNALLKAGAISQEAYNKRLEELEKLYRDSSLALGTLTKEQQALEGAKAALDEYAEAARDVFTQVKDAVTNAFQEGEDAIFDFVKTGKLEVTSLLESITDDFLRLSIREGITGPLSEGFSGFLNSFKSGQTTTPQTSGGGGGFSGFLETAGGFFSQFFGGGTSGGTGGQYGGSFKIPNGGIDDRLVMLRARAGETVDVRTQNQQAAVPGGFSGTRNYFMTTNINGISDFTGFNENRDQINNDQMKLLQEAERNM